MHYDDNPLNPRWLSAFMERKMSTKTTGEVRYIELRARIPDDGRVVGVRKVLESAMTEAEATHGAHSGEVATLRELIEKL